MCKVIVFTNTKKLNLKSHVNHLGNALLKSEKDGFGYAVQGAQGVFGEKCIAPKFKSRLSSHNKVAIPVIKERYSMFGSVCELTGPGIFHGRTSTNSEGLINTHPMQIGAWNLIHNGVVTDKGPTYQKLTDNDSEDVLHRLIDGIESVEKYLEGYYAFAAIAPDGKLHVARDSYATLFIAWSEPYDSYVLATTEELLESICKTIGAKIGPIEEMEEKAYWIFKGNELEHSQYIKPLGFTKRQAEHSTASIGRSLVSNALSNMDNVKVYQGGELITRSESHHRPLSEQEVNDASRWADWDNAIDIIEGNNVDAESAYYAYKKEVDNMDASYTITDENDNFIQPYDFYKLDYIAQEQCTIIRPDGTLLEYEGSLDLYWTEKGRLG